MDDGTGFLMSLLEETRSLAMRLDAIVMASSRSLNDYREYLLRTFGFEAPVEAALAYTPGLASVCELRARSGRIVHDLLQLGLGPQQIAKLPQCLAAPLPDVATGLGWLYVYERSRVQHPVLCARITAYLPEAKDAIEYFCRDEVAVASRWSAVAETIEQHARTDAQQRAIRAGAIDAFRTAGDWYETKQLRVA